MVKRTLSAVLLVFALCMTPDHSTAQPVRIMALGDSITMSYASEATWRRALWLLLQDAGLSVDFVGTQSQVDCLPDDNMITLCDPLYADFDPDHEGHSGYRADQITLNIVNWANTTQPDIVLLHAGTNDILQYKPPNDPAQDIANIIDNLRSVNPNVTVLVAQIIDHSRPPLRVVEPFNLLLSDVVAQKNTPQSPVVLVDQYTGFDPLVDTFDNVHPNFSGDQKIAQRWYEALLPFLAPVPLADAGPDQTVIDADNSGTEVVTLDGSGSGTYDWRVNDVTVATSQTANVLLGQGVHEVELTVTAGGWSGRDTVKITVLPPPVSRVSSGLLALYTFEENTGAAVNDVSGYGTPLNLTVNDPGAVSWSVPGALSVESPTYIWSFSAASKINSAIASANAFTFEFWIAPNVTDQTGPARIMALSSSTSTRNALVGQGWSNFPSGHAAWVVSSQPEATLNYSRVYTLDGTAAAGVLQHLVVTRNTSGWVTMYVDGEPVSGGKALGDLSGWISTRPLLLAADVGGASPWLGRYHLVAIYDRALSEFEVRQNHAVGPQDNVPPVAEAGPDQSVRDGTDSGDHAVTLDGSGSTDSDGTITAYSWREGGGQIATGARPTVTLAVGVHTLRLRVTDDDGDWDEDTVVIEVLPYAPAVVMIRVDEQQLLAALAAQLDGDLVFVLPDVQADRVFVTVHNRANQVGTAVIRLTPVAGVLVIQIEQISGAVPAATIQGELPQRIIAALDGLLGPIYGINSLTQTASTLDFYILR